jgi:hypothetical protein
MDEPKQSAGTASAYMIPIGLVLLLIAWVWPEHDATGPAVESTYSRLLGFRIDGVALEARRILGSVVMHLGWVAVAVLALRRTSAPGRLFAFGAAALLGLGEILFFFGSALARNPFLGASSVLAAIAGGVLIAGAASGFRRHGTTQIRGSEGGRA